MDIQVENKNFRNINKTPVIQQTAFWSEVKRRQGIRSGAFDLKVRSDEVYHSERPDNFVQDDMLILYYDVGDGHIVGYIPYGPTLEPAEDNKGCFLEELSESIRPYIPKNCIMLRYDLLWESFWAKNIDEAEWDGLPSRKSQEIRFNFSTQNWNLRKANTNILPSDTLFLDLKREEDRILMEMKPKTRYNIRLSARKGMRVRIAGMDELETWYEMYRKTCMRNRIYLHDINYFKTVLETEVNPSRSPVDVELLIADLNGKPLAAMFLVFSGKRATYLYGASASQMRNYMATYALQWEAIRRSKKRRCNEYDMFGVAPSPDPSHPMYGLYKFKTGFGGHMFHRMGCWDYPLKQKEYGLYTSMEMNNPGYHLG